MIVPFEDLALLNTPYLPVLKEELHLVVAHQNLILGDAVNQLEEKLAQSTQCAHAIGLSSGTTALTLILKALQVRDTRKEVVVPALTCFPVVAAILDAGLTPIFVDVEPDRWLLDPEAVKLACKPDTLALVAVHLYGNVCDLQSLSAWCRSKGIHLIEDCAQAQGAEYMGKPAGSFGIASSFSFYPTKILGALGDAGAVVTNDDSLAEEVKKLRTYGSTERGPYHYAGINARMDTLQAAFLLAKWSNLESVMQHKRLLSEVYRKHLPIVCKRPKLIFNAQDTPHLFPVLVPNRDKVRALLEKAGIGTMMHYPRIPPLEPLFSGKHHSADFPIATAIAQSVLSLPFSAIHSEEQILYVCNQMQEVLDRVG
jgi:dTDP-4-amino-4,6-dideoxygalactose transaminase